MSQLDINIAVYENSHLQCEIFPIEATTKAYIAGLEALYEKAEKKNPAPLTPKEIRQMRGNPVWCPEVEAWGIVKIDEIGVWKDKPFLYGVWYQNGDTKTCGVDFEYDIEERGLTLYRYKPPEKGLMHL